MTRAGSSVRALARSRLLFCRRSCRAPGRGDRRGEQHGELGGEGLGRGDADLGAGQGRQHDVRLAGDRAFRHVDDRQDGLLLRLGVAQRRQGIGGLARLRDDDADAALGHRRLAVAELRGDVDLDRQARELLEPVFADHAGVAGRAAGDRW